MRLFLLILIFIGFIKAHAATPPQQQTVDEWIQLALSMTPEQILRDGKGKFACKYSVVIDSEFPAVGKTFEEAQSRVALQCIKNKCNQLPQLLAEGRKEIMKTGDQEFADTLKAMGYTPEEVTRTVANRKVENPEYYARTSTCTGGSGNLRAFAVDMCFAIPMECWKK